MIVSRFGLIGFLALTACSPAPTPAPEATKGEALACVSPPPVSAKDAKSYMLWIPGGPTRIGSEKFHPEEAPIRVVEVKGFWIDQREVTNAEFAAFVAATGYVTTAEREPKGSALFFSPTNVSNMSDIGQWWRIDPEANWRAPYGKGSSTKGMEAMPVVHVTFDDAMAYAQWRGRDLPSEAEWERAARGGLPNAEYAWGDDPKPGGKAMTNHWPGIFPIADTGDDGAKGIAPGACYPANGYGLYDMTGNVWELTKDTWPAGDPSAPPGAHVQKGGSFLCADNFCLRYRPAARQAGDPTLGSSHTGFRTVWRGAAPG